MASDALTGLKLGLDEVTDLIRADPTPRGGMSPDPALTRSVTRACIVILCGHFEQYLRAINEGVTELINLSQIEGDALPERVRLQHSQVAIDELAGMEWTHRADALQQFVHVDAWLWGQTMKGPLDHARIIRWMRTPGPNEVLRLYQLWGIPDVFTAITRSDRWRSDFFLRLDELVRKRNNIAHGDLTVEATIGDIRAYRLTVAAFCDRADRRLARVLRVTLGIECDWY